MSPAFALLLAVAAPFSHNLHLRMVPDCSACHARAAASASVADNLLPDRTVCARCHQNQIPEYRHAPNPARQPPAPLARFSHAAHLKLGNAAPAIAAAIDSGAYLGPVDGIRGRLNTRNACQACHREGGAMPQMADCLVCHNQIDPPSSCASCHPADAKLAPASHTPDWEDVHSGGKVKFDKASCAVCHGRNFTCEGCH